MTLCSAQVTLTSELRQKVDSKPVMNILHGHQLAQYMSVFLYKCAWMCRDRVHVHRALKAPNYKLPADKKKVSFLIDNSFQLCT